MWLGCGLPLDLLAAPGLDEALPWRRKLQGLWTGALKSRLEWPTVSGPGGNKAMLGIAIIVGPKRGPTGQVELGVKLACVSHVSIIQKVSRTPESTLKTAFSL